MSEVESEREQLSNHVDELQAELEAFKSQVATEKKEALEQWVQVTSPSVV